MNKLNYNMYKLNYKLTIAELSMLIRPKKTIVLLGNKRQGLNADVLFVNTI